MQTLRPSHVPEFLRASSFYLNLNVTDDDEFSIPPNHMKLDTNVDTLADMTELLNTIRFWGSDIIPQPMIDFAARQPHDSLNRVLEPYRADLRVITTVCSIVAESATDNKCLEKAMESGNLEAVHYFHNNGGQFTDHAIALAAGKGAIDCLQYALNFRTPHSYGFTQKVLSEAVRNGCMECILFLQQNGFHLENHQVLVQIAASSGQCEVLKYLHDQGCLISPTAMHAMDAGHFNCLEYAIQHGALLRDEYYYYYPTSPTGSLAQRLALIKHPNQKKLLAMVLSRGSAMDTRTVRNLAKSGNWKCFKVCLPYIVRPPTDLVAVAVEKGFLACLRELHQYNVSHADDTDSGFNWITSAAENRPSSVRTVDLPHLAVNARQWKCLQFLIVHGCPMDRHLTTSLVQAGQLQLFRLAVEHGCDVSVRVVCQFAKDGNLELLQHALEHGCERSEEILRAAARHGQLLCLKYAHAQGCPWWTPISLTAARGSHLACLQYLQDHGSS